MMVKGITKDNILMSLIPNTKTIYTRYIRLKSLGLDTNDDVSIPYIIITNQRYIHQEKNLLPHFLYQWREGRKSTQQRPKISLTCLSQIPNQTPRESLYIWSISPQQLSCNNMLHRVAMRNNHGFA
jgi:hypothetical protein